MKKLSCWVSLIILLFVEASPVLAVTVESEESSSVETSMTEEIQSSSSNMESKLLEETSAVNETQSSTAEEIATVNSTVENHSVALQYSVQVGNDWEASPQAGAKISGIKASVIDEVDGTVSEGLRYELTTINGEKKNGQDGQELVFEENTLQSISFSLNEKLGTEYSIYYRVQSEQGTWSEFAKNGETVDLAASGTTISNVELKLQKNEEEAPVTKQTAQEVIPSVFYQTHIAKNGWQKEVTTGISGTVGKALQMEALKIGVKDQNGKKISGIQYKTFVMGNGWQGEVSDSAVSGTTGQNKGLEAVQMKLSAALSVSYDLYYRVHVGELGWLGWAKNNEKAGSAGYNQSMQAIEVKLVPKGTFSPENNQSSFKESSKPILSYEAHVRDKGWQKPVGNGETAGTVGQNLRLEGLKIGIDNPKLTGGIEYRAHVQSKGWQTAVSNKQLAGTMGQKLAIEAIQIKLTGEYEKQYDVYYQAHSANFGWLDWAKNNETAGSSGFSFDMQAIRIQLVAKGSQAPGATKRPSVSAPKLNYQTHVQNIGWQKTVTNGQTAGTNGQKLRLEAVKLNLTGSKLGGSIQYKTHVQNKGWQNNVSNGAISGTTKQGLRLEAIQVKLTGEVARYYDVYYRTHVQEFGWLGWTKNGANAGSSAFGYRMEAIQVKLVKKGKAAPKTSKSYYKKEPVELNVPFINQYSSGAPMGCEAASLLQALHAKGKATNYNLDSFLREMPISPNDDPNNGFAGSPYIIMTNGVYQSIFARPLANWGVKYGNVQDISGTSTNGLKLQLTKGNPVVVYVTYDFKSPEYGRYFWGVGVDNAHIMTLAGFNDQTKQYLVSDPAKGKYWLDAAVFERAYNLTKGAVVVK